MGFFKSLVKMAGRGLGKALEKVGEVTNIDFIEMAGINLQCACEEVSDAIGKEEEFEAEKARIEDTARVNAALTEFTLSLEKRADLMEKSVIREVNKYLYAVISELKNVDDVGFNIDRIKNTNDKVEKLIEGNIKKYLSKRVSIDDNDCAKILKMESGKLKQMSMENFAKSVLKEAISLYIKDIQKLINEQNMVLKDTIISKIEDLKVNTEKHIQALDEFEKVQNNEEELDALIEKHTKIITLCNQCEEFLV